MINQVGRVIDLSRICPNGGSTITLGTGDIQATLRWNSADDLDLSVTDPSRQTIDYQNRQIASGGTLDVDANAACEGTTTTPVENIFWPTGRAPQGSFNIGVNLYSRCGGSSGPIPFTLTLLVQGTTQTFNGTLGDRTSTVAFPFAVPLQNTPAAATPPAGETAPTDGQQATGEQAAATAP